jgi:hypothetical protein
VIQAVMKKPAEGRTIAVVGLRGWLCLAACR